MKGLDCGLYVPFLFLDFLNFYMSSFHYFQKNFLHSLPPCFPPPPLPPEFWSQHFIEINSQMANYPTSSPGFISHVYSPTPSWTYLIPTTPGLLNSEQLPSENSSIRIFLVARLLSSICTPQSTSVLQSLSFLTVLCSALLFSTHSPLLLSSSCHLDCRGMVSKYTSLTLAWVPSQTHASLRPPDISTG